MNRLATRLPACLILCTALGALSLPTAQAGSTINKCIDHAGRVTLTDQACDASSVSSTVAVPGMASAVEVVPAASIIVVPRQKRWTPAPFAPGSVHAALAGDMATMKQARVNLMLQDAVPRNRLASLER
ncbi:MAG: DUF4124 domain-containing protein [Pseudomonadota bacterium]|nr:DUF4124 domain-containing protein [Pseudomonadota bacterium]